MFFKRFTTALVAAATVASLTIASPAAALNQDDRNVVGGVVLGVLGTLALQNSAHGRAPVAQPRYVEPAPRYYQARPAPQRRHARPARHHGGCRDTYRTYRNGHLVSVCR